MEIETVAETVESSGDVLTTLTDIKQLPAFEVVLNKFGRR